MAGEVGFFELVSRTWSGGGCSTRACSGGGSSGGRPARDGRSGPATSPAGCTAATRGPPRTCSSGSRTWTRRWSGCASSVGRSRRWMSRATRTRSPGGAASSSAATTRGRRSGSTSRRRVPDATSEQPGDQPGRVRGPVGLHRAVVDRAADLGGDGGRDHLGGGGRELHAPAGPVPGQAVGDVEVLLEVVGQGEVEERAPGRGQLHAGGQAPLDHGEVAGGQVPVQPMDVGVDLQAVVGREG